MAVDSGSWWHRIGNLFGVVGGLRKADIEVKRILTQVGDEDPQVRRSAAWQLGKLRRGTPEIVDALSKMMNDHNEYVRRAATWALKNVELE